MVNAIGTAALALLIYDPRQILTPSFQMTFLCVLIVGAVAVPILERTSLRYGQALKNWDSIELCGSIAAEGGTVPRGTADDRRACGGIRRRTAGRGESFARPYLGRLRYGN